MTPNMLTRQQVFDRVAAHLFKQNKRSAQDTALDVPICLYLSDDGRRCAIGCLFEGCIPDERVRRYNNFNVRETVVENMLLEARVDTHDYDMMCLLVALQLVHDRHQPNKWKGELSRVAVEHGLIPVGESS